MYITWFSMKNRSTELRILWDKNEMRTENTEYCDAKKWGKRNRNRVKVLYFCVTDIRDQINKEHGNEKNATLNKKTNSKNIPIILYSYSVTQHRRRHYLSSGRCFLDSLFFCWFNFFGATVSPRKLIDHASIFCRSFKSTNSGNKQYYTVYMFLVVDCYTRAVETVLLSLVQSFLIWKNSVYFAPWERPSCVY